MSNSQKLLPGDSSRQNELHYAQSGGRRSDRDQSSQTLLSQYLRSLQHGRWIIAALIVVGGLVGMVVAMSKPAMYRSRVSLDIQALNESFLNMRAVDPNDKLTANSPETFLQTEIKLMQSESLVNRVKARVQASGPARLTVGQVPYEGLRGRLMRMLAPPRIVSREEVVADTSKHVIIKPLGMTRLVEITCDSQDPGMSAEFCNVLANEAVTSNLETRWESAQTTGEWLTRQLADVRSKLQISEQRYDAYAREHSLLLNRGRESVAEEKLRQLQSALSAAQADRISREASYRIATSMPVQSVPTVIDDEAAKEYQKRLAELKRQYAEMSTVYTPESSKLQRLQIQIKELEESVTSTRKNLVDRIRNEYLAAKEREDSLHRAFSEQERLVSSKMTESVQLNMLEREVESGRQLYGALLARVKEAGFASALRTSPIRVVDPANPPVYPFGPRPLTSTAVGLLLGALCGMCISVYRNRADTKLRLPGDAARYLPGPELGVIPTARREFITEHSSTQGSWMKLLEWPGLNLPSITGPRVMLELITAQRSRSLMADAYRTVMTALTFSMSRIDKRVLVVSSSAVGEGKTTVVSNLGIAIAQAGRRVLLVDGDMRMSRLHAIHGLSNEIGLRSVLRGETADKPLSELVQATRIPNLFILAAGTGTEDAASLLHSIHLGTFLERAAAEFDTVLIDTPPLLPLPDARTIAQHTSGMILVLRAGVATTDACWRMLRTLAGDRTPLQGLILNDFDPVREAMTDYYHDYYRYQSAVESAKTNS